MHVHDIYVQNVLHIFTSYDNIFHILYGYMLHLCMGKNEYLHMWNEFSNCIEM